MTRTVESNGGILKPVKADDDLLTRIEQNISSNTRLVLVSHITHDTCKLLPVHEISELIRRVNEKREKEKKIYFIVDAAQSVGQIPVDIEKINPDALVSCGHKWLRGRTISGFFYIDPEIGLQHLLYSSPYAIPPDIRFKLSQKIGKGPSRSFFNSVEEAIIDHDGLGNTSEIVHLSKCLNEYSQLGWNNIFSRIKYLGEHLVDRLSENPCVEILMQKNNAPGMYMLKVTGVHSKKISETLAQYKINVTYKSEEKGFRVSLSPFNTIEEIYALDRAIKDIARSLTR